MLVLWVVLLTLGVPRLAYAYIDPATTTYLIQIATAIVITVGVSFTIVLYRFRMLFTKLWVKLTAKASRSGQPSTAMPATTKASSLPMQAPAYELEQQSFVARGSDKPPKKAYGFAYKEKRKLKELKKAYKQVCKQDDSAHRGKPAYTDRSASPLKGTQTMTSGMTTGMTTRMTTSTFKEKWAGLSSDTRSFKLRLGIAALVNASLVFTIMIFGPLEMFAIARAEMLFDLSNFLLPLLLVSGTVFLALTLAAALMRGHLFTCALCFLIGLLIASYIQALFFNGIIGELTGDAILWHRYSTLTIINLCVWVVIVAVPFVIHYFSAKLWQYFAIFTCALIVVVQTVGLASVSQELTTERPYAERSLALTAEGIMELSSQKNIIVFVLDSLDSIYIDAIKEADPRFFDDLDGFVEYNDFSTRYTRTIPSVAYSLTAQKLERHLPIKDPVFLDYAYNRHLFIDDMVSAGWITKLYLSTGYDFNSKALLKGRAANLRDIAEQGQISSIDDVIDSLSIVKNFTQLSLYRYAPVGFKASFWMPSSEITQSIIDQHTFTADYQNRFMDDLRTTGLSANAREPMFMYLHLDGSHSPHLLGADGYVAEDADALSETRGCFAILYEYIRQLKELGIYEETCIIITGDHGVTIETPVGLFYKPIGNAGTALELNTIPVDDTSLVPTILRQAGVNSTAQAAEGIAYDEVMAPGTTDRWRIVFERDDASRMAYYTPHEVFPRNSPANIDSVS